MFILESKEMPCVTRTLNDLPPMNTVRSQYTFGQITGPTKRILFFESCGLHFSIVLPWWVFFLSSVSRKQLMLPLIFIHTWDIYDNLELTFQSGLSCYQLQLLEMLSYIKSKWICILFLSSGISLTALVYTEQIISFFLQQLFLQLWYWKKKKRKEKVII